MMVKSISPSSRGRYNPKKKKVWIKNSDEEDSDSVEIEVEVYDPEIIDDLMVLYNQKGQLVIKEKKEKHLLNLLV